MKHILKMNSEMKEEFNQEKPSKRSIPAPTLKVNAAIRTLGIREGRAMYFRKKYANGEAFTIDEWKQIMK